MDPASHVEVLLADVLGQIFVSSDTGSFEGFGGDLLDLVGDDVHDEGEHVGVALLSSDVVDSDFGVRDTSVVPGLGIRLASAAPIASSWSSSHLW